MSDRAKLPQRVTGGAGATVNFIQQQLIDPISATLYARVLAFVLVGVGVYFTVRTRFV